MLGLLDLSFEHVSHQGIEVVCLIHLLLLLEELFVVISPTVILIFVPLLLVLPELGQNVRMLHKLGLDHILQQLGLEIGRSSLLLTAGLIVCWRNK